MTAEEKIRLAKKVFVKIFGDFRSGEKIGPLEAGYTRNDLRKFEGRVDGDFITIIEQNPRKTSWCGKLASQGYNLAWVFKNGKYSSLIFLDGNMIRIFSADVARKRVESLIGGHHAS